MSTDYEFHCVECNDSCGQDNWRTPEELEKLLPLRPHFAEIGRNTKDIVWLQGWDAHGSLFPGLFHFFAEHEGHTIHVFDEYGEDWSRRGEMCAACGHSRYRHRSNCSDCLECFNGPQAKTGDWKHQFVQSP